MTLKDDAALLRRAAALIERTANALSSNFPYEASEQREHAAALESLATRLEGCVPPVQSVAEGDTLADRAMAKGANWMRAEFLRRLEGRE